MGEQNDDVLKEYEKFLTKQVEEHEKVIEKIINDAVKFHDDTCDAPSFLKAICSNTFARQYMEDFTKLLMERQRKREAQQLKEEFKKSGFFGSLFHPRPKEGN